MIYEDHKFMFAKIIDATALGMSKNHENYLQPAATAVKRNTDVS